jgi:hypothetical protein
LLILPLFIHPKDIGGCGPMYYRKVSLIRVSTTVILIRILTDVCGMFGIETVQKYFISTGSIVSTSQKP